VCRRERPLSGNFRGLAQVNGERVFVYGEEVDDSRTVDYEGLTALNNSATQELSKRLEKQAAEIAMLKLDRQVQMAEMGLLKERMAHMMRLQARASPIDVTGGG
jgi:hypothetical protein